ncbi:5'-nucleotidase C-terminal domain-containing protein [Tateyamaria sp. SN6-1]|uniref:5'-nucleotidase C-terminal domain-containing protein n=1 Tax=Tateyamaria sp. SN6-1 TaxID=3092148 RepID=UPI0039F450B4
MREQTEDHLPSTTLRLLATSDVHMHLTGWDPRTDQTATDRGFNRVATLIRAARKDAPGAVVLLDNGDSIQGTPHAETAQNAPETAPHPWAEILHALDYDAAGLGNHDFDFGLGALHRFCAGSRVPILSASPTQALDHVQTHVILNRDVACSDGVTRPLRIGVTSVLPPQTLTWNHVHLEGVMAFHDGITAARGAVDTLRAAGVDLVLMLCHSGISDSDAPSGENFARALAQQVHGIDAMILGHTHEVFPGHAKAHVNGVDPDAGTICDVPAAMPGYAGAFLAQIDLTIGHDGSAWRVTGHKTALRQASDAAPDPEVQRIAAPHIAKTRTRMHKVVGQATDRFHTYFSILQSGTVGGLMATAMIDTIRPAARDTAWATLPILAAVAPAAAGGRAGPDNYVEVTEQDIRTQHLAQMCPYENTIWAHCMTGAELRAYVETSLAYFAPSASGLAPLASRDVPAFNFDVVHGIHTTVDPFAPLGARVVAMTHDAQPIRDTDRFLVAMTSYRGAGGGGFPGLSGKTPLKTETPVFTALQRHLRANTLDPRDWSSVWSFATSQPRDVIVETSPRAIAYLEDIAAFAPEPLGLTDAGFMQLRVTL